MKNNKYSDYKIFHFEEKIASFKSGNIIAPIYVRIKPINLCNHGCFFCIYSDGYRAKDKDNHIISGMHTDINEKDTIPTNKMLEILDDLKSIGVKAVTYSGGGEPLLHKGIVKIMEKTLENNIDLSIITNGQLLNGDRARVLAKAKWVRVSMDYTSSKQMIDFRNVSAKSFDEVITNLYNFSKIKNSDCDLAVNYIVHKDNFLGLYDFSKLLKENGVNNVRYSPMWTPDFYEYHSAIAKEVQKELNKASNLIDSTFSINTTYNIQPNSSHSSCREYDKCYIMQTVPVIGADLNVYACHNKAYDNQGKIGSIKDCTFSEMWFGDDAKDVFNNFNPKALCQHECSNDRKNILINSLLDASVDNFV